MRRMRVLREVAARGTIAAAARALAFTPSAVSQQLAALEREAGVALLDRHGGRVRLTEAGRRLVARTEAILIELEAASAELSAAAADVAGDVHVAAFPSAERALLAPAIAALAARHPDVRVQTTELEPEASLPALRLGDVDVIVSHEDIARPAAPDARLERVDLMEDPLRIVLPPGHPADGDAVALADLRGERWVATPPGTACRAIVERACGEVGYVPDVPFTRTTSACSPRSSPRASGSRWSRGSRSARSATTSSSGRSPTWSSRGGSTSRRAAAAWRARRSRRWSTRSGRPRLERVDP